MNFLIDTHSHVYYDQYKDDLSSVINSAKGNGVERIICVGTDIKTSYESIEIANKYDNVFCTIGCHPHDTSKIQEGYIDELEQMCKEPKVVAIGETGLDYYYNHSPPSIQKKCFVEHIELSKDVKMPVVIHNRNSDNDLLEILKKYKPNGVVHCFSGDVNFAKEIIDLGLLLSFTGIITFNNSTLADVISKIDLDDFMLETDSPYLTPIPFRGRRNEPKHVKIIAEKIAKIKNLPIQKIAEHTTRNAYKLFHRLK